MQELLRYFAVTGKASTEYCAGSATARAAPAGDWGHQHMDAAQAGRRGVQGISQRVQKAFRRINAGKLTKSVFYAWSEEARKKKRIATTARSHRRILRWLKES